MKTGKAACPSVICAEMAKASGSIGVDMITVVVNLCITEETIPSDWQLNTIVKGDALDRGNYSILKLMDQVMKFAERIFA